MGRKRMNFYCIAEDKLKVICAPVLIAMLAFV